ncbi:hypothetical protein BBC0244_010220 [Bartonella apihabitans]|uniref:DUF6163 family protein n=1 Tax=Bartonella apihabitans TaxID=2750929 RepID=UPI00098F47EB|nr:DUF6163 family protein [Bartonella apihabitans]AQT44733.1 hypothetical protein BBC0244_010220 [Bartonella apihabitans]
MDNQLRQVAKPNLVLSSYSIFLHCLAFVALLFSIFYWIRMVGVFHGTLWRIDRMPWLWQVLTVSLSVVYPIAALGLWMGSLWGIILWFFAALTESLAFTVYSSSFIFFPSLAVFHFLVAILFVMFRGFLYLKKKKKIM